MMEMMEFFRLMGWFGLVMGLFVAPSQLIKTLRFKKVEGISFATYAFLIMAIFGYLLRAIGIGDVVFILSQSINLIFNIAVFTLMIKYK